MLAGSAQRRAIDIRFAHLLCVSSRRLLKSELFSTFGVPRLRGPEGETA
jgi:hypothetical protein